MKRPPKDVAASVRARLLALARARGEDFQFLLTRYANERFLYRLARSRHGSRFVLKGAALFTLWTGQPHRATRDLDLLGFGEPGLDELRRVFKDVLAVDTDDDGVRFDARALSLAPIRETQEYGGVRVVLAASIAGARTRLQIDVGFGDAITPAPVLVEFPSLLEFAPPRLRAYPRETVIAEKVEAMVPRVGEQPHEGLLRRGGAVARLRVRGRRARARDPRDVRAARDGAATRAAAGAHRRIRARRGEADPVDGVRAQVRRGGGRGSGAHRRGDRCIPRASAGDGVAGESFDARRPPGGPWS